MRYFQILYKIVRSTAIIYTFLINTALHSLKNFIQHRRTDTKRLLRLIKGSKDNLISSRRKQQLPIQSKITKFTLERRFYDTNFIRSFKHYQYLNEFEDRSLQILLSSYPNLGTLSTIPVIIVSSLQWIVLPNIENSYLSINPIQQRIL